MCEICAVQAEATRSNGVFLNLIRLRFTPVASYSFYCSLDGQLFKAKFHAIFLDQRLQSVKNEKYSKIFRQQLLKLHVATFLAF